MSDIAATDAVRICRFRSIPHGVRRGDHVAVPIDANRAAADAVAPKWLIRRWGRALAMPRRTASLA